MEFPTDQKKAGFVEFIAIQIAPQLSKALKINDWDVINSIISKLKEEAKTLGAFAPHFLMEHHNELWCNLLETIKNEVEKIFKFNFYDIFNNKMLYNIITPAINFSDVYEDELLSERIVSWGRNPMIWSSIKHTKESTSS